MRNPVTARLHGHLDRPADLTVGQLRDLPSHRVDVSFDCKREGAQRHGYEGPRLWDVLRAARPRVDLDPPAVGGRRRVARAVAWTALS